LARLGSLEFLVKDRQSGALAQSLQGQVIRPKARSALFSGMPFRPQDRHRVDCDRPAKS